MAGLVHGVVRAAVSHHKDSGGPRIQSLERANRVGTATSTMLWIDAAVGGRARISEDDYLEGVPELMVEVAASSVGVAKKVSVHA